MIWRLLVALALFTAFGAGGAVADGMIFPVERPNSSIVVPGELFTVKYHNVDVTIQDQLCTTRVDQVFVNETDTDREGMYIFPMPEGSAITNFSMFAGETEIKGKLMDRGEARSIYESIVRQRKDPAILEYINRNTFRARVYPIPARSEKRIKLSYAEVASKTGSTCRYTYPLSTERFSAKPLQDCRVRVAIKSKKPVTNVYSPTHTIDLDRVSDKEVIVNWRAENTRPDTDMILYYTLSEDDIGMDLIAHRESGEAGYFMLLASPRANLAKAQAQPKNVIFVMDRSGSMGGEKIEQAKAALKFCLNTLKENDRFNIITFNDTVSPMFPEIMAPDPQTRRKALNAIDSIDAGGGTNINQALIDARTQLANIRSPRNYIVFLTDGLPTSGVTDVNGILKNAKTDNAKIFAFGVGYDVNTHLLDKLSAENHGTSDYVRPKEDIEVKVSSFFAKVNNPVLANVKLDISGVQITDRFPGTNLPDIFSGTQLIVFGRYSGSGKVTVTLSGLMGDSRKTFTLNTSLPAREEDNQFIPQLWASRKIGYLLDEIRLHSNKELVDEVVRLSKEYGIPTEYTSFLADERQTNDTLAFNINKTRDLAMSARDVKTGSYGVAQSLNARVAMDSTQVASAPGVDSFKQNGNVSVVGKVAANMRIGGTYQDAMDRTVVAANVQNVARRTFYQRGDYWEDGNLKPDQKTVQIKQFSDAHFALLKRYPKLSQYSTLGNIRVMLENNQAVEIGPEGKEKLSDEDLKTLLGSGSDKPADHPTALLALCALGVVGWTSAKYKSVRKS